MQEATRDSIFLPILSTSFARKSLLFCLFITVISAFITPPFPDSYFWSIVYKASSTMADVESMSRSSKHPLALATTYFLSIVLSFASSIIIAFSKLNMDAFNKLQDKGKFYRCSSFLLALLVILLPIFQALPINELHRSYAFFQAASEKRTFLAIWGGGYLSLSIVLWSWILFELSNFSRWITSRVIT